MHAFRTLSVLAALLCATIFPFVVHAQKAPDFPRVGLAAGTPDPTLLPIATTTQWPMTSAYNALNVPSLPAGGTYFDPYTGVKVYKLTSATFPTTGFSWTHDYAEGGDEVSLPLNASGTRAIHVLTGNGNQWLIDFTPGVGVSNVRSLTSSAFPPFMSLCVTFSNNPATPYYMYLSQGSTIRRIDVRTMTEVPGGGWPVTGETEAMWLHQNENDSFFTWMRGANGPTIVGYEPATGIKKTYTNPGLNEPRIDRDALDRFVCVTMTTPQNQALFWDWKNDVITWSSPVQSYGGDPPVAHQASLRGYWIGVNWNLNFPWQFFKISYTPNSIRQPLPGGPSQGGGYCNGNWNQHPANPDDQWFACHYYGALAPDPSVGALAPGGVLLSTVNGQRRILAHLYNTTANYTYYSFAKLSSDGAYVLFTSDMNGSARSDLFLAELPTNGSAPPPPPADTTPPAVTITAPANGATVSAAVTVTANATDNVGVAGVQFVLDGLSLGAEDTTAPWATSWNTAVSTNGSHTLTAVARDAAGNRATSSSVVVTVSNAAPDTTPPTVPTGLAATAISPTQINLSWTASTDSQSGVAGYKVFRGGTQVGTSASTAYSNTALSPSTTYIYTVAAYDVAGNTSAQSTSVSATTPAPPPPPAAGIIAFLRLDESAGATTFSDASGSGNNGSCAATGCPTAGVAGKVGGALSFDGIADMVTIPHNSGLNAFPLTVAVWFKTNSMSGVVGLVNKYVASSYNGYNVFLNNGNVCAWYDRDFSNFVYDNTGCTFNVAGFNDNTWHQVVYVVDSSGGSLYLDGLQRGATLPWTGVAGAATTLQDVQLGHYPGAFGGAEYFSGAMDQVRIYNTALTASDVTALYAADNPPLPPADTTPPAVSLTSPVNGATVSGSINVTANASDNIGVVGVQFQLDGANLNAEDMSAPWAASWNTTTALNGPHTLTAVARDAAGNRTTSPAVTMTVANSVPDTTPPVATITSPANGATVSAAVTISAAASDNVGVAGVQFLLDGAALGTEVTIAPFATSWNTTLSANGSHTLTAVARDAAGNRGSSAAVSVTVSNSIPDTTPPTVPTRLGAVATSSAQINLTWNASSDTQSGVAGYKIFRGGTQIGTTVSTSYSDTGLSSSTTYTYSVSAYDVAGNSSAQSPSVTATTQAPPPPANDGTIAMLHLDEGAASTLFTDASGSGNHGSCVGTGCPTSGVTGKLGRALSFDGLTHMVSIKHNATLNAFPLTVAAWFKTGSTSGVVGLINKYVANSYNGYNVFINNGNVCAWYIKDGSNFVYDGSGCTFNIPGFNDNTWHHVAYVVDSSGGKLYLDGIQKGTTRPWTGVAGGPTTLQDVRLGHYPGAFGGAEYFSGLLDEVRIYNAALTASQIGALVAAANQPPADTTAPAVAISAPADGAIVSATITVNANASDDIGVAGVQFQLDGGPLGAEVASAPFALSWNTTAATNGAHTLSAVARDAAGNRTTSAAVMVTVANSTQDTVPPSVAITAPANGATVSAAVTVTANASDNVGVAGVQFQLDGVVLGTEVTSAPYSTSWNTTTASNGSHTLTAVARDAAGNRTTSAPAAVYVANSTLDTTPPSVAITAPANGATVSATVTVSANASDNVGVAGVQFLIDGAAYGPEINGAPWTSSWNTATAANGSHTLTAVARDGAGNRANSAAVIVTVSNSLADTIPPNVLITAPANGATVTGTIQVTANASDNVGVAGVQFYVDNALLGSEVTAPPFGASWNSAGFADGSHTLMAVARDAAGNTMRSASITVTSANVESPFRTASLPGRIEAEDFDRGGEGISYHDLTPGNQGGYYRAAEDVDIINPYANGYVVSDFQTGEWLKYTFSVAQAGSFKIQLLVSSTSASSRFHVEIDGFDVTGPQKIPNTGAGSFTWIGPGGINIKAGQHVMKVVAEQEFFTFDAISAALELAAAPAKSRGVRH